MNFNKKTIVLAVLSITIGLRIDAIPVIDNPMTRAVIQVYDESLRENPTDYDTYFRRGNEFYRQSEYMRALDDVNNALKYMPSTELDLRIQALLLRASIYNVTDRPEQALTDLTQATSLSPDTYAIVYQKANTELELGDYTEAKADYIRLQRLNSRSTEALIGLARIAVKENNLGLANDYINQAVAIDPSNSEIYVRQASVHRLMGDDNAAVQDLLLALSTDSRNTHAVQDLIEIGSENYPAVMTGLSDAIRQAPSVGMFYYIRAMIAQAHFKYGAAITDFNKIIDEKLYNYHGLYASLAECHYALGDYIRAMQNIDQAMSMVKDYAPYYTLRSKIQLAQGEFESALNSASQAVFLMPTSIPAIVQKGLALIGIKDYSEASSQFGEAALSGDTDPIYLMMRAWVCEGFLHQPIAARGFYRQVDEMEIPEDNIKSFKGFALLYLGQTELADEWMQNILTNVPDYDGMIHYYATCFYAQAGNSDRALDYMKKALELGYANYYDWTTNNEARINVAPLRKDERFRQLLHQYLHIFNS